MTLDVAGRVAVVTGPTSGIGREIARELAARGATVVLAARDGRKAEAVAREVGGATETLRLDLADLASVRAAAAELRARHPRLALLVNNAGIHTSERVVTRDGFESTFQVNHLGHFLLTRELLPALQEGAPARVTNVASSAHRFGGPLDLRAFDEPRRWNGHRAYCLSKLCNVLFTRELARRLAGTGVEATCAHPGAVRTDWGRGEESGLLLRAAVAVATPFMRTPRGGAVSPLVAALGDVPNGAYVSGGKPRRPAGWARDDAAAEWLWRESERRLAG